MLKRHAKFNLGQVVRHKKHPFRGVIFDIDTQFSNTEEWYNSIPEDKRPMPAVESASAATASGRC